MRYVYKVWSNEFDGDFLSVEAYEEVMLRMNTADYTLHRSRMVDIATVPANAEILCYNIGKNIWFTSIIQEMSA